MRGHVFRVALLSALPCLFSVTLTRAGTVHPYVDTGRAEVELDSVTATVTYEADTAAQAGYVSAFAAIDEVAWFESSTQDDDLKLTLAATGVGSLPQLQAVTSLALDGDELTINGVTRAFDSADDAGVMAAAIALARALPSGASLAESGGDVIVRVDLEETWISVQ